MFTDGAMAPDGAPPDAGPPMSEYCGDAIRDPVEEECDDGPGDEADLCTADCRVQDGYGVAEGGSPEPGQPERELGAGPHVAAATGDGMLVTYLLQDARTTVMGQLLGPAGRRVGAPVDLSGATLPIVAADPVAAPLPSGGYAVAWIGRSSGTPDIEMARVQPTGAVSVPRLAHASRTGLQDGPDMLWVGGELVVAWTSDLDVLWRRFDATLAPLGPESALAMTDDLESSVALASWNGAPAAAWRAGSMGFERIHVRVGSAEWFTPEHPPGPQGDRPTMTELDSSHLLVVYAVGTDPDGIGSANTGKLRMAVLQRGAAGEVTEMPLLPLTAPYDTDASLEQRRPSLARVGEAIFLAYETASPLSTEAGRETFLQRLEWSSSTTPMLVQTEEQPLQHDAPTSGDQRNPRIVPAHAFPGDALLGLWEDHSGALPDRPDPDILMSLRPLPVVVLPPPVSL